jgi:hypothetical protein
MPKNPILWWRAQDSISCVIGGSGIVEDSYSTVYANGLFGRCMDFTTAAGSGKGDYVAYTVPTSGTFECWVKTNGWSLSSSTNLTSTGSDYFLFAYSNGAYRPPYFYIQVLNGGGVRYEMAGNSGSISAIQTGISIPASTWFRFACTWNSGSNVNYSTYWNGVQKHNITGSVTHNGSSAIRLYIGKNEDSDAVSNCYYDNIKVYNFTKSNYDDMFNERGGMNDVATSI